MSFKIESFFNDLLSYMNSCKLSDSERYTRVGGNSIDLYVQNQNGSTVLRIDLIGDILEISKSVDSKEALSWVEYLAKMDLEVCYF